ncbi:MAG: transglutaminase-like domain-containing protein [Bacillota bacterium]|nr:transglutaminase-like domain-containing protein [Bacillota bacterium]
MNSELLEYYLQHGPMTEIKANRHMVADIPPHIPTIVKYVQNILLHQHWSGAYGVELSDERKKEPLIRGVEGKLSFLRERGFGHVSEEKTHGEKMIGICRDFSVVGAGLCREAGIPARARCGFATYFEAGKYVDHWVFEYWDDGQQRWIMVDAQLDELQQKALKIKFDPLAVGEGDFITGPKAWLMCRAGNADPNLFGIFQWWGYDYLNWNLLLDANSLLKVPMQPWDDWGGYKSLPTAEWTEGDFATIDELARLTLAVDADFEAFSSFVQGNERIEVPAEFIAND